MHVINDRYRLVKNIKSDNFSSLYLAYDINNVAEPILMRIINEYKFSSDLLSDFLQSFDMLRNIRLHNVLRCIDFDIIKTVDSKRVFNLVFFYTCEYCEDIFTLEYFIKETTFKEKLLSFVMLTQSINVLHKIGKSYNFISLENLSISRKGEYYKLLLNDLAFNELYNIANCQSSVMNIETDLKQLGYLLLSIFGLSELDLVNYFNLNPMKEVNNIGDRLKEIEKIFIISAKLLRYSFINHYENIEDMIDDVNGIFKFDFSYVIPQELERLCYYTPFIGRNIEIQSVKDVIKRIKDGKNTLKLIIVHGEAGIGKTRFLMHLCSLLKISGINTYDNFEMYKNFSDSNDNTISHFLRKIISVSDNSIFEQYALELSELIPEINREAYMEQRDVVDIISGSKCTNKIIIEYLRKAVGYKKTGIIIDNIENEDDLFFKTLIDYVDYHHVNKNVIVIISYSDNEIIKNEKNVKFFNRIMQYRHVMDICLNGLNANEVELFIKSMFLDKFDIKLINESLVKNQKYNPTLIREWIRGLYLRGYIYFDRKKYIWTALEDCKNILVSSSIKESVISLIDTLNQKEIEVLRIISFLNIPVAYNILVKLVYKKNISKLLDGLVLSGGLEQLILNGEKHYIISNSILKEQLYNSVNEPYRKILHSIIAQEIRVYANINGSNYRIEFLEHLEKGKMYQSAIKDLLNEVDYYERKGRVYKCIQYLQRILDIYNEIPDDEIKINVLIRIGRFYRDIQEYDYTSKSFRGAIDTAIKIGHTTLLIDALDHLVGLYSFRYNIKKFTQAIRLTESYLKKVDYLLGRIRVKLNLATLNYYKKRREEAIRIAEEALQICPEELKFMLTKGRLYNIIGMSYSANGNNECAIENFNMALTYYEKIEDFRNKPYTYLQLAKVCASCGDMKARYDWLLKAKATLKYANNFKINKAILSDFGYYYFQYNDYKNSLKCYEKIPELLKYSGDSTTYFISTISSASMCIYLFMYKEANELIKTAKETFRKEPNMGRLCVVYYFITMSVQFELGNYEEAKYYIDLINNEEDKYYINIAKIYSILIEVVENRSLSVMNIDRLVDILQNKEWYDHKPNLVYRVCLFLYENNYCDVIPKIVKIIETCKNYISSDSILHNVRQLVSISNETKYDELMLIYDNLKSCTCDYLVMHVELKMGNYYYNKNEIHEAINFYIEGFFKVRAILKDLPKRHWIEFIRLHGLYDFILEYTDIMYTKSSKNLAEGLDIKNLERLCSEKGFLKLLSDKSKFGVCKNITLNNSQLKENIENLLENKDQGGLFNLNILCRYLALETISNKVVILIQSPELELNVIASSDTEFDINIGSEIIYHSINSLNTAFFNIIKDEDSVEFRVYKDTDIKDAISIPIFRYPQIENINNELIGCLYFQSNKIVNKLNINHKQLLDKTAELVKVKLINQERFVERLAGYGGNCNSKDLFKIKLSRELEFERKRKGVLTIIIITIDSILTEVQEKREQYKRFLTEFLIIANKCFVKSNLIDIYDINSLSIIYNNMDSNTVQQELYGLSNNLQMLFDKYIELKLKPNINIVSYPNDGLTIVELMGNIDNKINDERLSVVEKGQELNRYYNSPISLIKSNNNIRDMEFSDIYEIYDKIIVIEGYEEKLDFIFDTILQKLKADFIILFKEGEQNITFDEVMKKSRKSLKFTYNKELIEKAFKDNTELVLTDWELVGGYNNITKLPYWNSIIIIPINRINGQRLVLYMGVNSRIKEYKYKDLQYIKFIATIVFPHI